MPTTLQPGPMADPVTDQGGDQGLWFLDTHVRVALTQDENDERISILEHRMPGGFGTPLHVHREEDEIFVILEGAIDFELGETRRTGRAGETLVAPRGVPHRFRVASAEGARCLTITRGGFERLVRTASRPASGAGLPAPMAPTPAQMQALSDAAFAQGIAIIGPPMA